MPRTSNHFRSILSFRCISLGALILLASTLPSLVADIRYTDSGNDHLWSNTDNWQGSIAPNDSSTGAANWYDGTQLEIPSGTNAVCRGFMLGMYGSNNTAVIAGGTLACNWLDIGRSNHKGGNGTLTIISGSATVNGLLSIPNQDSSNTYPANIGQGQLNISGGSISANSIQIGNGQNGANGGIGSISITGGSLVINGDARVQLQNYIDAGYITTATQQSFELDYDISNSGKTTLKLTEVVNGLTSNPYPGDGNIACAVNVNSVRWTGVAGADSYKVYFGTSATPPLVANLDSSTRTYAPNNLENNQVYHWRVDAIEGATTNVGADWSFATNSGDDCDQLTPPFTDYCEMLSQEIQGKKHGFLAGNKTYYIGGFTPSWNISGYDTIGFTHPFHNDLRSRGYGMVQDPDTGYGHDLSGWEFYKHTRVAYGTVIINGARYENPIPAAMYWRPDRMICEYQVAGINIREDKYIALNDTACSIITSDQPVTLEFAGQSFYREGITQSTTATCNFDAANNLVHIVEGGVNLVKPTQNNQVPGVMMYDGMSTIISASKPIQNYTNTTAGTGQQFYSFRVPCDENGLSLTWAMHDDSSTAIAETQTVLVAPQAHLQAKTDYMNDLLNNQIPYFRCSDQDIVDIYYFLWAIHMMYYIDLSDEDPDFYPHTQTAVNNFLGIHRYDAAMQIPVGSWTVDKASFAYGNVLRWKTMLDHADLSFGRIPADNLGKTWYSGLWGGVTSHVPGAWQIYQHSGDLDFLSEAYGFYRTLMWDTMPGFWGRQYEAADCLGFMALELGYPQSETDHWQTVVNSANFDNWFNYAWTNHGLTNIFTFANPNRPDYNGLDWSSFGYMRTKGFPNDKARAMVETWAVDGPTGFLSDANGHLSTGLLAVRPRNDWDKISENAFFITPDTNAFMLLGMFATNVDDHATKFALEHLKNYNMKWGIPTAPEAINRSYELFGDQYSNFNAGKILVILEGIFGLSYSVVDSTFTVADNLPLEWDYMETYVPIGDSNNVEWTHVRVERIPSGHRSTKRIQVQNNTQQSLRIQPWLENKSIIKAPGNYSSQGAPGHIAYEIEGSRDTTLELKLSESNTAGVLAESLRLTSELLTNESEISIQFGITSSASDTTVILKRATQLDRGNFEEIYRFDTSDQSESMAPGVNSNVTPNYFTITDELQPAGRAFYKVSAE